MKNDLVEACTVFWGEWLDHETQILTDENNPEKQYLIKESLEKLSKEAKEVANVLINLPDEMFTQTGRIIQSNLIFHMNQQFGWSSKKTRLIVKNEIANLFI